jgi:hypothetical protein
MVSEAQCRTYAEDYRRLSAVPDISLKRAMALMAVALSWIKLAGELERLADIEAEERRI